MLIIRPAAKKDWATIKKILQELDLYYAALTFDAFFVAENENGIIGTAQFRNFNGFNFLSSLAVVPNEQKKGIASAFIKEFISSSALPIYLYTILPAFFEKFGFKITQPIPALPSKDLYECEDCHLDKCVCMAKG
ncbi:MAG: GNAT family N-acetyltransferase [Candidatus Margulisiibacteriota bacterium]